jgi:hypothetical protein
MRAQRIELERVPPWRHRQTEASHQWDARPQVECGDGHDHPRAIRDHPPGRQACGQEVRRGVGRDRPGQLRDIQIDQRDTQNLRVRDADRVPQAEI